MRNRLERVAEAIEAAEAAVPFVPAGSRRGPACEAELVVVIDGAHVRAVAGHWSRHLDVTVGKVETAGRSPRRFALAPLVVERPAEAVRAALIAQGWRPGRGVTVINDGEAALPNLVSAATGEPISHILDWWHISMRVRHIEQALAGVYTLRPKHQAGLDLVSAHVERLRHLIWNGYSDEAGQALWDLTHLAGEAIYLNGDHLGPAVRRFLLRCRELREYLDNNSNALIDYASRYRAGRPISSSRAEGCVEEIANARMAKRRRMRWSPRGAHCVATVRIASTLSSGPSEFTGTKDNQFRLAAEISAEANTQKLGTGNVVSFPCGGLTDVRGTYVTANETPNPFPDVTDNTVIYGTALTC